MHFFLCLFFVCHIKKKYLHINTVCSDFPPPVCHHTSQPHLFPYVCHWTFCGDHVENVIGTDGMIKSPQDDS